MRIHARRINNRLKDAEQISSLEDEELEIIQQEQEKRNKNF